MIRFIGLFLLMALSGCGFQPLYGDGGRPAGARGDEGLADVFQTVEILETPDRLGQSVRNQLIGALTPRGMKGSPRFALELRIEETLEGYAFRADRAITRQRLELVAHYRLIDLSRNEPVLEDRSEAWTAYDVVQSDFANVSAQRDAEERVTARISERIVSRLARHLRDSNGKDR